MTMTEALQRLKLSWPGRTIRMRCELAYIRDSRPLPDYTVRFEATISVDSPYQYVGTYYADTLEELCVVAAGAELHGGIRADEATAGLADA